MNHSSLPPVSKRSKQFATLNGVGHRARMRSKLLEKGAQALEDYELLEMILYLIIPRKDTKPLAKQLINNFGSLDNLLSTEKETLKKENLSDSFIIFLDLLKQTTERLILPDFHNRPYLKRWKDVVNYLIEYPLTAECSKKKKIRLLFLNSQQMLICDEHIFYQGTEVISLIIQKAITFYAVNLITIYYVSGDEFTPEMRTQEAKFALTLQSSAHPFDLNISDHIIYFDSQYFSIFKNKSL